jgi:hypothetical protein
MAVNPAKRAHAAALLSMASGRQHGEGEDSRASRVALDHCVERAIALNDADAPARDASR